MSPPEEDRNKSAFDDRIPATGDTSSEVNPDYTDGSTPRLGRRGTLALLGLGGLGLMSGQASAQRGIRQWRSDVNANGHTLLNLGALEMIDDPVIKSTDGSPLELKLNDERVLRLDPTSANSAANVVVGHPNNTVDEDGIAATIAGGGSSDEPHSIAGDFATVSGGRGNTSGGTFSTVSGGHTNEARGNLATIGGGRNNEVRGRDGSVGGGSSNAANGLQSTVAGGKRNAAGGESATVSGGENNEASGEKATIGGGESNSAESEHATVAGGEDNTAGDETFPEFTGHATVGGGRNNIASGRRATVGGGENNESSLNHATVSGGLNNKATGGRATVGGGTGNEASASSATVGGGVGNEASALFTTVGGGSGNEATQSDSATIGGGRSNTASGRVATIPGGQGNIAGGSHSFAAGREAKAIHDGAFVFGDSSVTEIESDAADEAFFQMPINADEFKNGSARSKKTAFESVDPADVLEGVESLEVSTWEFRQRDGGRHMGPMAGEFAETFGLGDDDGSIATVDADGVALAAIQGLSERSDEKDEQIADLQQENGELRERLTELEDYIGMQPIAGDGGTAETEE